MAGLSCVLVVLLWPGIIATFDNNPLPQCNDAFKEISSGFQISRTSFPTNYKISFLEKGRPEHETKYLNASKDQINNLKPCTDYQLSVTSINNNKSQIFCSETKRTRDLRKEEIRVTMCTPGHICYQTDWTISPSELKHDNKSAQEQTDGSLRFKLDDEDFCSSFTVKFTPINCKDSSFTLTNHISSEVINPQTIDQPEPVGLPAEIKPVFPSNCKNLSVEYTCAETGSDSGSVELSDVEPFTDYSCSGLIKNNSVSTYKTLPPVQIRIDCDLKITPIKHVTNASSIKLDWTTTSQNCGGVLPQLTELSHQCSCRVKKYPKHPEKIIYLQPDERRCTFDKLEAFTDYTCEVQPTYRGTPVPGTRSVEVKTKPGEPGHVQNLNLSIHDHNVIRVICDAPQGGFKGPQQIFIARLGNNYETKDKCSFYFKDLSYLTTYEVTVTADNGHFKSKPIKSQIKTSYNSKLLIGFMIFIIAAALGVAVFIKKTMKSRKNAHEEMMLSTAINVPPRRRRAEESLW